MSEKVIVELCSKKTGPLYDLEVPLNITAIDLLQALNQSLQLGIQTDHIEECYLVAENPIALLRGNTLLSAYHIHDGSRIYVNVRYSSVVGQNTCCFGRKNMIR